MIAGVLSGEAAAASCACVVAETGAAEATGVAAAASGVACSFDGAGMMTGAALPPGVDDIGVTTSAGAGAGMGSGVASTVLPGTGTLRTTLAR